jgi:uncharacterized protein (DUF4213/DUF364 family)
VPLITIVGALLSDKQKRKSEIAGRFSPIVLAVSDNWSIFVFERDSPEYVTDVGSRKNLIFITRWLIPFFGMHLP